MKSELQKKCEVLFQIFFCLKKKTKINCTVKCKCKYVKIENADMLKNYRANIFRLTCKVQKSKMILKIKLVVGLKMGCKIYFEQKENNKEQSVRKENVKFAFSLMLIT